MIPDLGSKYVQKEKKFAPRTSANKGAGIELLNKTDPSLFSMEDLTEDDSLNPTEQGCAQSTAQWLTGFGTNLETWIGQQVFPGMPDHYSLRKKMSIQRSLANSWAVWDTLQIFVTLFGSGLYIYTQYELSYSTMMKVRLADVVVTQFFLADFLLHWYMHQSSITFLSDTLVALDVLAMVPVYLMLYSRLGVVLDFLRCLRILRLVRLVNSVKFMHNTSGVNRQVVYLTITLVIMIFLSSCFTQFLENSLEVYTCSFIGAETNWEPSCEINVAFTESDFPNCDCIERNCYGQYGYHDSPGQPTDVRCNTLSFFDTFYYIIITLSTIGYGDIVLRNDYSKAAIIFFIIASVVLIPMRLSELQMLLSLTNPYAKPYRSQTNDSHVIVTGHTSDKKKMENFLKEFFHPDRTEKDGEEFHAVILASVPPSEDIRALLGSGSLESKVTWVLGSPLSVTDLKKVKADTASAIFFLINADIHDRQSRSEDATNVLSALSVNNFNSSLTSFVQVLRPENGDILHDSDVDMILCLDEYKTAVQARNAICPGFSTFIENIFHSMGSVSADIQKNMPPWYEEYLHGAGMELYFVPLPVNFIKSMRYCFRRIAEVIYMEWECIVLGMCHKDNTNVVFNPLSQDLYEFVNIKAFYKQFSTAIIMADDQHMADEIYRQLTKTSVVVKLINDAIKEEHHIPCNTNREQAMSEKERFMSGLSKFRATASAHANGVIEAPKVSSLGHRDTRFALPTPDDDIKHVKDEASALNATIKRTNSNDGALHPSVLTHSYDSDEFSDDVDDELKVQDPDFTDEEDYDSDDEAEDVNYIGYRKKDGQAVSCTYEGFGKHALHSTTIEEADALNAEADDSDKNSDNKSQESSSDSDGESNDGDQFFEDQGGNDAFQLAQLLESEHAKLGEQSKIVKDASHLRNHVIVTGSDGNLLMFVGELRSPSVSGTTYHPILIVHPEHTTGWNYIVEHYNDVFLLEADPTRPSVLKKMALKYAFSFAMMGARMNMNRIDEQVVNTGTLFSYLKIEQFLPASVSVTVELSSSGNMAVLNATIMRRHRELVLKRQDALVGRVRGETLVVNASTHKPLSNKPKLVGDCIEVPVDDLAYAASSSRRQTALFDENGRFATKRQTTTSVPTAGQLKALTNNVSRIHSTAEGIQSPTMSLQQQSSNAVRRGATFGYAFKKVGNFLDQAKKVADEAMDLKMFSMFEHTMEELWDAMDTHHVLPVFASAKAYVPSSFESLLVQSFYVKLTPIICEKFVCGQLTQTMTSQLVPKELIGRRFIDIFRLYIAHQVLCLGLYRAAQPSMGATIPYLYVSPPHKTILASGDYVYVYSNQASLRRCKLALAATQKWK